MNWTAADAQRTAEVICARAGLDVSRLALLRFGNNAVFGLGDCYVLRLMRPTVEQHAVQQEIDLVREFARLDVPAVRLADVAAQQPLAADGCLATVWERLAVPEGDHLYPAFGRLVRTFHERTTALRLTVDRWCPLASAERRLERLRRQYPSDDLALLDFWYERIATELEQIAPCLPSGVIHGQAEIGNVLLRSGELVFIDFERLAIGVREWDLIDTAVTVTRFGLPDQRYREFADAYGFDVRAWEGYQTFRRLWELRSITWLMQHGQESVTAAEEINVRLRSWREDDAEALWSSVV